MSAVGRYEELHARIVEVARDCADPALARAFALYQTGGLTQRELLVHPAFDRVMHAELRAAETAVEEAGHTMDEVRARVRKALAAEGFGDLVDDPPGDSGGDHSHERPPSL